MLGAEAVDANDNDDGDERGACDCEVEGDVDGGRVVRGRVGDGVVDPGAVDPGAVPVAGGVAGAVVAGG